MWFFLLVIVKASLQFHQKNMKVGDIRPQNILIEAEGGNLKLVNRYSFEKESINYFKSLRQHIPTFLSPEEMVELSNNNSMPKIDPLKA